MRKINNIPRILKINRKTGFQLIVTFNNNERRLIDFTALFKNWNIKKTDIEYPLLKEDEFKKVKVSNNTLTWDNLKVKLRNENRDIVEHSYQMDPIELYRNSSSIESGFKPDFGNMVKRARIKAGLSQNELALRSGTTKSYLSRLENNKSGVEVSTLKKIVETGLGKKLKLEII